ncbi:hypothetical protein EVAR_33926_1 [Eumeta japonica]|uniref:Uncharacterized protein n=1 Tax=Eumeta variegata TaxID=151549 RepID=A0A4C1VW50_EUMVA|nr:hypothetical protein EVAR_33926_1 [Eumeta japonica]
MESYATSPRCYRTAFNANLHVNIGYLSPVAQAFPRAPPARLWVPARDRRDQYTLKSDYGSVESHPKTTNLHRHSRMDGAARFGYVKNARVALHLRARVHNGCTRVISQSDGRRPPRYTERAQKIAFLLRAAKNQRPP